MQVPSMIRFIQANSVFLFFFALRPPPLPNNASNAQHIQNQQASWYPIHYATSHGSLETVQFLYEQLPSSITEQGNVGFVFYICLSPWRSTSPISSSLTYSYGKPLSHLAALKHTQVDAEYLPIHLAAEKNRMDILRFLYSHCPDSIHVSKAVSIFLPLHPTQYFFFFSHFLYVFLYLRAIYTEILMTHISTSPPRTLHRSF